MIDHPAHSLYNKVVNITGALLADLFVGTLTASFVKSAFSKSEHSLYTHLLSISNQPSNTNVKDFVQYGKLLRAGDPFKKFIFAGREGLVYALRSYARNKYDANRIEPDGVIKSTFVNFYCGGVAGLMAAALSYIVDYRRTMTANGFPHLINHGELRTEGRKAFYQYMIHADRGNVLVFYKGFLVYALGETIKRGISFGLFDTFKAISPELPYSVPYQFSIGLISSATAILAAYPVDVVRRRQLMTKGKLYEDSFECMKGIIRQQGWKGLFTGVNHMLLSRSLAGALTLTIFQQIQTLYYGTLRRERAEGIAPKYELRTLEPNDYVYE